MTTESPRRLGIIAGAGSLPQRLIETCKRSGIEPFLVAIAGHADPSLDAQSEHVRVRIGAIASAIAALKRRHVTDLVLVGGIRRPSLSELRPDTRTLPLLLRVGFGAVGDDSLLGAVRRELEREGFRLHGVHEYMPELLMPEGPLGKYAHQAEDADGIARAIEAARRLGELDIGQAVVVQQGHILGVEGAEGTDALIRRCADLKRGGRGPILVKLCKPQQDRSLDLPALGPETIRQAKDSGFSGIVAQANAALLIDPDTVRHLADEGGLFMEGASLDSTEAT